MQARLREKLKPALSMYTEESTVKCRPDRHMLVIDVELVFKAQEAWMLSMDALAASRLLFTIDFPQMIHEVVPLFDAKS